MHALGDSHWTMVRDLALPAILCAECREDDVQDELAYFRRFFREHMGSTYELLSKRSTFDPAAMEEHDLAVCQLESYATEFVGHSITIFRGRIYDAAERASMPLETQYLDRCVREHARDADTFHKFRNVCIIRPKAPLIRALRKRKHNLT